MKHIKRQDNSGADCGAKFEHDAHWFKNSKGYIKACDGSVNKKQHWKKAN